MALQRHRTRLPSYITNYLLPAQRLPHFASPNHDMDYSEEPEEIFLSLSPKDYCRFYDIEMDSFTDDVPWYQRFISHQESILELGCGTGRLTRLLSQYCRSITGLDISQDMIDIATSRHIPVNASYQLADMTRFSLSRTFEHIIIPYNTLNLLGSKTLVLNCLHCCRRHLAPSGTLLLHLYNPRPTFLHQGQGRLFQFKIFELEGGGKLIKESLRTITRDHDGLELEERYKIRLFGSNERPNYRHTLTLWTPGFRQWLNLLNTSGFKDDLVSGCYTGSSFSESTDPDLLIAARLQ